VINQYQLNGLCYYLLSKSNILYIGINVYLIFLAIMVKRTMFSRFSHVEFTAWEV
jgi:hypothetical protein